MTEPRTLATIGKSMGSEHLMDVEFNAMITRAEKRIDDHLRFIQQRPKDKAFQTTAKAHLAQLLSGLKRLESYREMFR